ncbi:isopentenyl-diphosphate delta-isomerase [Synechococcus sp. PCC 7502]|uniref:isopentenyl-diphosphate Delta-isomerase n=1 Tax=Synechococcus sp. PCC 7502 TaxID=1173263 RepID=UPI00029FB9E8|nr:isopentenyl-diphosphate Delta-isomerase [Synechococcus sp. PCC 7502]AFY74497.1 isopentenyl-diphosphate delta-isomerase [Synechococcus sp. PCC 7502]
MDKPEPLVEHLILVDQSDRPIGIGEKMWVHQQGLLHRAFSIFVLNSQGQILLQKRAISKYHSGGLWTNTCCSHPRPDESILTAANRRLQEEMGFTCELTEIFSFIYESPLDYGLIEHEYDHVLLGKFDGEPILNPLEAEAWQWIDMDTLKLALSINPELYTFWLKACFDKFLDYTLNSNLSPVDFTTPFLV